MGVAVRIVRHNWRESAIYIPTNNKFRSHVCIGQWHTDHRFGFKGGEKTTEGRLEGVSPEKPYGRAGSTTHLITRHTVLHVTLWATYHAVAIGLPLLLMHTLNSETL